MGSYLLQVIRENRCALLVKTLSDNRRHNLNRHYKTDWSKRKTEVTTWVCITERLCDLKSMKLKEDTIYLLKEVKVWRRGQYPTKCSC